MAENAYEIPAFGGTGDKLHGWLIEAVSEGENWLRAQKPASEWNNIMEVLGPLYNGSGPGAVGQSQTGYNRVRREFREIVATLSNFRHAGEFNTTDDDAEEMFDRAHMLSNLDEHWWRVSFAQLAIRNAVMYAVGKGTGYLYQDWDKSAWGPNRGDVRLRDWDPNDVTFIQLPKSHDLQQAYVVLIREELPLMLAKRMYANNAVFAKNLRADRDSPGWIQKGLNRVQQFISPALRVAGSIRKENTSYPTVDIWHAYTMDGSINEKSDPVKMGANGTNWSYTVPALGDPIPQGIINPATGQQFTLPATPEDCLLFPLRRLTIFARTGVAYDGSSPWWHGAVPLARIRFNDLPWEALGASQVGDARTIQDGIIQIMRSTEDSIAARLDPPAIYDDSRVDKAWAEGFNPRKAGVRAAADLSAGGSPIVFPVLPQQYDVPQSIPQFVKDQEERMDYVTCARDLVAIAKAGQIPSSDTLEKLLEMAGPIVQDMVQALVIPLTQLGEWRKAYYFQFYTKQRMLQIADPEGIEQMTDVKYIPELLVPAISAETAAARSARVRAYLGDFRYDVTESGITEINRMSRLLLYIQLSKSGALPISWWTMAKAARVPNYGPPPSGTKTEFERVVAQKNIEAEQQVELMQELQKAQAPTDGEPQPPGGAPTPTPGAGPGRPAQFSKPPQIRSKDGGTRSTITSS